MHLGPEIVHLGAELVSERVDLEVEGLVGDQIAPLHGEPRYSRGVTASPGEMGHDPDG
jgi:hypothetical protein